MDLEHLPGDREDLLSDPGRAVKNCRPSGDRASAGIGTATELDQGRVPVTYGYLIQAYAESVGAHLSQHRLMTLSM